MHNPKLIAKTVTEGSLPDGTEQSLSEVPSREGSLYFKDQYLNAQKESIITSNNNETINNTSIKIGHLNSFNSDKTVLPKDDKN